MTLVAIDSQAFEALVKEVKEIKEKLNQKSSDYPLSERYLDIQETCQLLHISKRTLQNYRDQGIIPFSQIGGKIYFRASDIEEHMKRHYIKGFKQNMN